MSRPFRALPWAGMCRAVGAHSHRTQTRITRASFVSHTPQFQNPKRPSTEPMKHYPLILAAAFFGSILSVSADLTIPSDGSDGALNITQDTVIDLSQAVTGTWDQNNSANAGKGVYDPNKWAVVFKYSSVNIAGHTSGTPALQDGRNVRFINHPSHAPVVWLVQGNVTINGFINLRGGDDPGTGPLRLTSAEPGPGGFRGGATGPLRSSDGYGPRGGTNATSVYDTSGKYISAYGNPQIIPLIGGSGSSAWSGYGGAGGGGAILIAAQNIVINGLISASGGHAPTWAGDIRGSGGAIRLIASTVSGSVASGWESEGNLFALPDGRVRIETNSLQTSIRTSPETIGVPPANSPIIWPAANAPKARVISVDAAAAPADPTSPLIAAADVAIQNNAPVNILIETRDFPIEGVVQLAVIPKFSPRSWLTATRINGDINVATWRVTTTLPQGFVTLQARATQP